MRGVWRLLTRHGLIEIHFADLARWCATAMRRAPLLPCEAIGPTRSREVVDKLLAHPMLDEGQVLAESDAVLVSLMGGKDLTMAEVNRVMEQVNRQCEHAQSHHGRGRGRSVERPSLRHAHRGETNRRRAGG